MSRQKELLAHLLDAFPPRAFRADVVSHDCPECAEIRDTLSGSTWWSIPGEFVQKHFKHLPLLTSDAYQAFLPAWLREAVLDPTGEIARFVLANLMEGTVASRFSRQQSYAVVLIAKWISEQNGSGPDDPATAEANNRIRQMWGDHGF